MPELPSIFSPFPKHLDMTDLKYLHRRDALTLPSEHLQVLLLKAYFEFVHCHIPLLDAQEFLSIVKYGEDCSKDDRSDPRKRLSLQLFQAVMFAAVDYVSMKALRDEGYGSRDTARRVLFSRIRVCFFSSSLL